MQRVHLNILVLLAYILTSNNIVRNTITDSNTELGNFRDAKEDLKVLAEEHPKVPLTKCTKRLREKVAISKAQHEAHSHKMRQAFAHEPAVSAPVPSEDKTAASQLAVPQTAQSSLLPHWLLLVRNIFVNLFNGKLCQRRRRAYRFD
jgi:phage/plasmid-associated DNA primase